MKAIGHIMAATGLTAPEWASEKGFSKAAVYDAINGKTKRGPVRKAIASAIGRSVDEVWPPEKEAA